MMQSIWSTAAYAREMSSVTAAIIWVLVLIGCSSSCESAMIAAESNAMAGGEKNMSPEIEVELDIFSGNPNPTWVLSENESAIFLEKLHMLPKTSGKRLSNNLGYRGFIIRSTNVSKNILIQVQNGTVILSQGEDIVYYSDLNRNLERWLLNSGRSSLESGIFRMVESELKSI